MPRLALAALALTIAGPASAQTQCKALPSTEFAQVASRLVRRAPAEYPPIAQMARLEGTVRLEICVAETGQVVQVDTVTGPAMLVGSATYAAWQSRFSPGPAFRTAMDFDYSLNRSPAAIAQNRDRMNQIYSAQVICRNSVVAKDPGSPALCKTFVDVVVSAKGGLTEQQNAYGLAGRAYFDQNQFAEALRYRELALKRAREYIAGSPKPALAYWDVAVTLEALGRSKDALETYKKAENGMASARKAAETPDEASEFAAHLASIREEYRQLLEKSGQSTADLDKRIAADRKR